VSLIPSLSRARANRLHSKAQKLSDTGDDDAALAIYAEALQLDPSRPNTLYNIGLIHKYRRAWRESFDFNRRACELAPADEAAAWNLAIAATALRDWVTARKVWNGLGMNIEPGDTPIDSNLGWTPVRLAEAAAEVVWAQRIDPVRARIGNVPLAESGFRYGDVVLHDGAAVGYRLNSRGEERAVFNVLELHERSAFSTFEVDVLAAGSADIEALGTACEAADVGFEDWTSSVRHICKACSEGRPHGKHDTQNETPREWRPRRYLGLAARDIATVERLLNEWTTGERRVESCHKALDGGQ
jgi:tetratricopeptide (TPR) repeat protein